jgi:hypothetical protein
MAREHVGTTTKGAQRFANIEHLIAADGLAARSVGAQIRVDNYSIWLTALDGGTATWLTSDCDMSVFGKLRRFLQVGLSIDGPVQIVLVGVIISGVKTNCGRARWHTIERRGDSRSHAERLRLGLSPSSLPARWMYMAEWRGDKSRRRDLHHVCVVAAVRGSEE